jgi:hypothetical protein
VNQGTLAPEVRQTAIETLKTIDEYGKSKKVFVTIENRGGGEVVWLPSENRMPQRTPQPELPQLEAHLLVAPRRTAGWNIAVEVIKAAGIYASPDTGGFPNEENRAARLRAMYPLSSGSSHAHYYPARFNEANAIKISKEVGYKGLISIEASPVNGPDPFTRIQTVLDELLRDI